MKPIIESQITFLYTNNLKLTANFYEDVMGLRLVLDQGTCRIYQVCWNSFIGFCTNSEKAIEPADLILTLVTPDVDRWYDFLKDKGIEFEKSPQFNSRYLIYHAFLRDPNGYLIEIQKFDDPRW